MESVEERASGKKEQEEIFDVGEFGNETPLPYWNGARFNRFTPTRRKIFLPRNSEISKAELNQTIDR